MSESPIPWASAVLPPFNPAAASARKPVQAALAPAPTQPQLLAAVTALADTIAAQPNRGETALPVANLHRLAELGLLLAPLPPEHGGLGLASDPAAHPTLLKILATIGGADLVLGRLYEGHVNAILLIASFGTPAQLARAAEDCRAGRWFGVWNTGEKEPLRLEPGPVNGHATFLYRGAKNFATGVTFVQRPIVTAALPDGGWQMTLPRMESPELACVRINRDFWHPLGMESSESFAIDFTGARIDQDDLVGIPGDFYRDPLFYGGAIRFAAVHAGAVLRLHRLFAAWLEQGERGKDPYQVARLGEIAIAAQESALWVERAAAVAAECLHPGAQKLAIERIHETADMTRIAIERIATGVIQRVTAGVGAHGLLRPSPFERILRNLTMYLRQPVPDHTLAAVGRASLRKSALRSGGASSGFWLAEPDNSLPAAYFDRIYQRNRDPWNFETSQYEADKYAQTLASLPRPTYPRALEIGCSIGVLTQRLAARCESLHSVDISETALASARARCAGLANVTFTHMQIPRDQPTGRFDLIVVSEVAYYWQREDLNRAIAMLAAHQQAGAHLLLVHHTKPVPDYPLTGDEVHDTWLSHPAWRLLDQQRHEGYRLDLLERLP